jgi:hypothetical protein
MPLNDLFTNILQCRWLHELEERFSQEKLHDTQEQEEDRKRRLAMDLMAASSGSAESLLKILKSVFRVGSASDLSPEFQGLYADALKLDAKSVNHAKLKQLRSELPGLCHSDTDHDLLAHRLGMTLAASDGYSVNDLTKLLADKKHETLFEA